MQYANVKIQLTDTSDGSVFYQKWKITINRR
jgi:hypothetical protein